MNRILQSKETEWLDGKKKKKTHVYAAYKTFTSDIEIHGG